MKFLIYVWFFFMPLSELPEGHYQVLVGWISNKGLTRVTKIDCIFYINGRTFSYQWGNRHNVLKYEFLNETQIKMGTIKGGFKIHKFEQLDSEKLKIWLNERNFLLLQRLSE